LSLLLLLLLFFLLLLGSHILAVALDLGDELLISDFENDRVVQVQLPVGVLFCFGC
jgi:hypothetical protein